MYLVWGQGDRGRLAKAVLLQGELLLFEKTACCTSPALSLQDLNFVSVGAQTKKIQQCELFSSKWHAFHKTCLS